MRTGWNRLRLATAIVLIFVVCGNTVGGVFAAGNPSGPPNLSDSAELDAFLAELLDTQLKDKHIAGATLAVVKDGELLFAKGYGYADVEKQIQVDPETTVFNIGSVAKLFTWTAVMQLYEQGRLDLDADINQYLDFQIPATFPEPITLKHLMAHTPGFENTPFGLASVSSETLIPNGAWLAGHIPARLWPPGQKAAYSNYGAGLAGYIVERVSGMTYEQYIEQHLLAPLGMTHSTLRQPMPPELAAHLATGYKYFDNAFQPQGIEYIQLTPAGGLKASATDMARFMIAHLQHGRYCEPGCSGGEARILSASTAQLMQTRLWAADERLNGMNYGFYELSQNGQRVIGHFGDTTLFHSLLALLPEQNVGLFVSYNSISSTGVPLALFEAFMNHYYPDAPPGAANPLPDHAARASRFAGSYQMVRLGYSGGGKVLGLLYTIPVKANASGELMIGGPIGGTGRYLETAPLYFEEIDGDGRLRFIENEAGEITDMYMGSFPQVGLRRIAWYETPTFNLGLLAAISLMFLSAVLVGLARFMIGLFRRREQPAQPGMARAALAVWTLTAVVGLALEVVLFLAVTDAWALASGQRGLLTITGGLSILVVGLAMVAVVMTGLAWRDKWLRVPGRIFYSLVTIGAVALVWFLAYWNQLGWQWW